MPKYEVQKNAGGDVLIKDGFQAYCPFVAPMVVQSGIAGSQPQLQRISCSTGCALAELVETDEKRGMVYEVSCGAETLSYPVTEWQEPKPENKLVQV